MVGCISTPAQKAKAEDERVDEERKAWAKQWKQSRQVLVLGPSGSGKSTVIKQLQIHPASRHGPDPDEPEPEYPVNGIPDEERKACKASICRSLVRSMRGLVLGTKSLSEDMQKYAQTVVEQGPCDSFSAECADALTHLWSDERIKATFARCKEKESGPHPSIERFFDNIPDIASPEYTTTNADLLHFYDPTPKVRETSTRCGGKHYRLYEVPTHGSGTKRLLHAFHGTADSAIVVVPLNTYDQPLYSEDGVPSPMQQAMDTFSAVASADWFRTRPTLLWFNQVDVLKEKIGSVSLRKAFPEYDGPEGDANAAVKYILDVFNGLRGDESWVYPAITCARDMLNMRLTIETMTEIIDPVWIRVQTLL